jgi:hypothetical protein
VETERGALKEKRVKREAKYSKEKETRKQETWGGSRKHGEEREERVKQEREERVKQERRSEGEKAGK